MTASSTDSTAAAEHFLAGAIAAGLTSVVLSPGSRSTPLAVAADRTEGLRVSIHLDERCAAFAALGEAKATGGVVGLICTSGTAAANYLPAIAEASMSNVSVVAITADRPPEHQNIGVGQSFDQRGLYGVHVRHEITMPVDGDGGADFTERAGWRAVSRARELHGPVHVNWAFRLPLEPRDRERHPTSGLAAADTAVGSPERAHVARFASMLERAARPVIVAGPDAVRSDTSHEAHQVAQAADALGIPILADVLSGLRGSGAAALIDAPALVVDSAAPVPDLIIRLGQTPTAKSVRLWWEAVAAPQILLDPLDDWHDPSSMSMARFPCASGLLLETVVAEGFLADQPTSDWVEQWRELGERAATIRQDTLDGWDSVTEAHVASALGMHVPAHIPIVVSSSMPVRDLDTFSSVQRDGRVLANRGINGIDGVVSTAIGVVRGSPGDRCVVHLGDVAALHDVGGILDAARQGVNLTVVIPNNDGGGIFSFLPAKGALDEAQFTTLFHTPHGTTFGFLAGHDAIHHELLHAATPDAVAAAIERSFGVPGVSIVEVAVSTADRLALRDALSTRIESP